MPITNAVNYLVHLWWRVTLIFHKIFLFPQLFLIHYLLHNAYYLEWLFTISLNHKVAIWWGFSGWQNQPPCQDTLVLTAWKNLIISLPFDFSEVVNDHPRYCVVNNKSKTVVGILIIALIWIITNSAECFLCYVNLAIGH